MPQFLSTESAYHNFKDDGIRINTNEFLEIHSEFLQRLADSERDTAIQDYNSLYCKKFSNSEFSYFGKIIPENYQDLKRDREYNNYLNNRIGMSKNLIGNYERNIKKNEGLIDEINNERSI